MFDIKLFIAAGIFVICLFACIHILSRKNVVVKKDTDYEMKGFKIIYADSSQDIDDENIDTGRLLYSSKIDVQGKPDFVFKNSFTGSIVPVEIKSGNIKNEEMPHYGDLMQLVCYFYMVEEEFGRRPKYGKIIYKDYMFVIKNTGKLRKELVLITKRMRKMLVRNTEKTSSDYVKCRHCVCAGTVCEFYDEG